MSTHTECFNLTIQDSFVDDHEDLFFTDLTRINCKLAYLLVFY